MFRREGSASVILRGSRPNRGRGEMGDRRTFPFNAMLESLPDDRRLRRSTEVVPLPGILALLVRERPFHLEGLVTRWKTQ